jgi:hypothetical protein
MGCGVLYHFDGEKNAFKLFNVAGALLAVSTTKHKSKQNVLRESNRPRQPPPFRIISFAVRIRNLL